MTKRDLLSEELYRLSSGLEKHNLFFVSQRNTLMRTLSAIEYLASCINMDRISNDQAQIIINTLETILHTRYFDFASNVLKAEAKAVCVQNQQELLFKLTGVISLCIGELCNKNKNRKESVRRYIAVIKTVSSALLPCAHEAWISAEEADRITRAYLKCD